MAAAPVGESVSRILDRGMSEPYHSVPSIDHIVERLSKRFGNGANPKVRQALYRRIGVLCESHGESVYVEVCSVAAAATSATHPDRYFCAAISRRLREMGYLGGVSQEL